MQNIKTNVAGTIAFVFLGVSVFFVIAIAWLAFHESVYVDASGPLNEDPTKPPPVLRAKFIWMMFLDLVRRGTVGVAAFTVLITFIGVASQYLSTLHKKRWPLYVIAALCFAGFAASWIANTYILYGETLASLLSISEIGRDKFISTVNWLTGGWMVWFISFLGVQLGISLVNPTGVLKQRFLQSGN